jgi:hypothetical protein
MGYILNEPKTFINVKLTDAGRRQLSLGSLNFTSAVLSDREINYGIDRTEKYDIINNRIISPVDTEPGFSINFDSTNAIPLEGNQLVSAKQFATGATGSYGMFTGTTISSASTAIDTTKLLGNFNTTTYTTSPMGGGTSVLLDNPGGSYFPNAGDLVFIPWEPIQNSGATYTSAIVPSGNPTVSLWYRVTYTNGSDTIYLDRPTPDFASQANAQTINTYFYPYNGPESYYGTGSTINPEVWNMNIVRTQSVEGTPDLASGYTSYGSIEYNGTKSYLGFNGNTVAVGILHYTNEYTGNTYAEQFVETSVRVDLPYLMWHNSTQDNGGGLEFGVTLYDVQGITSTDTLSNSTYRDLRDGVSTTSKIVGRVYHKLKLMVITDAELLTAMTYKSNRNYTLPELNLNLSSTPKYPLTTIQATGLCKSGKTYFATYITESDSTYSSGSTFGYPQALHCGYVQQIDGETDTNGNNQFLTATFPTNSFPYLRSSVNMDATSPFSGTGWNANKVQLLVSEQDTNTSLSEIRTLSDIAATDWKLISDVVGNGIYTGDNGDLTIEPNKLNGYQFTISQEDYDSGTTYVLDSIFTTNDDHSLTGLTFGDESFLFGNVDADILSTTYKTVITTFAKNDSFNSSNNSTFDNVLDNNTYITEVGILDNSGNLVAAGKPTYPIKKNEGRFLTFQLQIDF